MFLSLSLLLII